MNDIIEVIHRPTGNIAYARPWKGVHVSINNPKPWQDGDWMVSLDLPAVQLNRGQRFTSEAFKETFEEVGGIA